MLRRALMVLASVAVFAPALAFADPAPAASNTTMTRYPSGYTKTVTKSDGSYVRTDRSQRVEGKRTISYVAREVSTNHPKVAPDPDYGRPDNITTARSKTVEVRKLPLGFHLTKTTNTTFHSVKQNIDGPIVGMNGSSGTERSAWSLSRGKQTFATWTGKTRWR